MTWKQPIPTGLEAVFGEDYACNLLYRELIYRAANSDGFFTMKNKHTITIKRGQTVFGRRQYAKYLGADDSKVERNLRKLCEIYQKVSLEVSQRNCTIVTLLGYEELIRFEPENEPHVSHTRARREPDVSTSKSVESVKNVKKGTLEDITEQTIKELSVRYEVRESDVSTIAEELRLYVGSTGKTYKDYPLTLQAWVRRKLDDGKLSKNVQERGRPQPVMTVGTMKFYTQKEYDDWNNDGRNLPTTTTHA